MVHSLNASMYNLPALWISEYHVWGPCTSPVLIAWPLWGWEVAHADCLLLRDWKQPNEGVCFNTSLAITLLSISSSLSSGSSCIKMNQHFQYICLRKLVAAWCVVLLSMSMQIMQERNEWYNHHCDILIAFRSWCTKGAKKMSLLPRPVGITMTASLFPKREWRIPASCGERSWVSCPCNGSKHCIMILHFMLSSSWCWTIGNDAADDDGAAGDNEE